MKWVAYWMLVVAILHFGVTVVLYGDVYSQMWHSGAWNTVETNDQKLALWFGMGGLFMLLIATCFLNMNEIPRSTAISLLTISVVGVILMPKSGFWFLLVPSLAILYQQLSQPS